MGVVLAILLLASPAAIEFVLAAVAQGSTAADVHQVLPNPRAAADSLGCCR